MRVYNTQLVHFALWYYFLNLVENYIYQPPLLYHKEYSGLHNFPRTVYYSLWVSKRHSHSHTLHTVSTTCFFFSIPTNSYHSINERPGFQQNLNIKSRLSIGWIIDWTFSAIFYPNVFASLGKFFDSLMNGGVRLYNICYAHRDTKTYLSDNK